MTLSNASMVEIRIGDQVQCDSTGGRLGTVKGLWGDYASVEFGGRGECLHIPIKDLKPLVLSARNRPRQITSSAANARYIEREAALVRLRSIIKSDFVNAAARFVAEFDGDVLTREDLDQEKAKFVTDWVSKHGKLRKPDPEQAIAVASVNGNTQVVARAGSGKTTTLVTRAVFLIKHCGVSPGELLLLAFNRKAAKEIRHKLLIALVPESVNAIKSAPAKARASHGGRSVNEAELEAAAIEREIERYKGRLPHVMTFHALAHAIVHPEGQLLYDGSDGDAPGLSRAVQEVIDEFLRSPRTGERVRSLMMAHYREDWDRLVEGGFHLSKEDQLTLLRSLPRETLAGDYVKSHGEKVIADFLFERGIAYKYERNHWWGNINYKPDFTIFKTSTSGVVIEYFGLAGEPQYDEQIKRKREYWGAKDDWSLVEIFPSDIAGGVGPALEKKLTDILRESGIPFEVLSEDEIWRSIRPRAIDRFTKAVTTFIGRCRKKGWDPEAAARQVDNHTTASPSEEMFLSLGVDVFNAYVDRLAATGDEDFDGGVSSFSVQ